MTPDAGHRPKFMLNMPLVQIDSVGAGCGSFVRIDPNSRRPEVGPDSAGARDRHRLARGRGRDGLDHRPQPRPRPPEPRLLPRRPGDARHRARPRRGRAPGRRAARARRRGGGRGRDRAVRDPAQRGRRPHPRQGLLPRRLHPALLRRRRPAARGRLHRGRALPAGARARVGGRLLRLRLRLRRLRVPLRPPGGPAARCRAPAEEEKARIGMLIDGGLALLEERVRGGVREVRRRARRRSSSRH